MINAVSVPLRIDRGAPGVTRIAVSGIDLTGASWHGQIRLAPDTPGGPVLDLPEVTDGTVSGVRLAGVDTTGALPISYLDVQVAGTVVFPPANEPGQDACLAWDLFVIVPGLPAAKWCAGPVTISATVTKETTPDPLVAVPLSGASDYAIQFSAATVSITLAGAELLAPLLTAAAADASAAQIAREGAEAAQADADQARLESRTIADRQAAPRDPVALWAIDALVPATATAPAFIANLAEGSPAPSSNWALAPRRAFETHAYWSATGATIADNAATDENGREEAATLVGAGDWAIFAASSLSAGKQFVVVVTARRGGSADQPFALTGDQGATRQAFTATSAYQRFAHPFVANGGSNQIGLIAVTGGADADLDLASVEIFAGDADLGAQGPDGNIYTRGALTGAKLNAIGYASLPRYAYPKWTVSFVAEDLGGQPWVLSDATDYTIANFGIANTITNPAHSAPSGAGYSYLTNRLNGQAGIGNRGGLWDFEGLGPHLFTQTFDGDTIELWLDDVRVFHQEGSAAALSLRDLLLFADFSGNASVNVAGVLGVWDRALSADEIRRWHSYQRLRNPTVSLPGLRQDRVLIVEGDSIQGSYEYFCWPWQISASLTAKTTGGVYAVGGSTLADVVARAPIVDPVLPPEQHGRLFALTLGIGTNDLWNYAGGAAQYIADLRAYCSARAAAGWDVLLWTLITRNDGDGAEHNARRAVVNTDIRSSWALYGLKAANRVLDVAAEAQLGIDNSRASYPALWADDLHPSAAGQAIYQALAAAALNAIEGGGNSTAAAGAEGVDPMAARYTDKSITSLTADQAAGTSPVLAANVNRRGIAITPPGACTLTIGPSATQGWPLLGMTRNSLSGGECPSNDLYIRGLPAGAAVGILEA